MRLAGIVIITIILTGCAGQWGQVPYIPPSNTEKNIAKIRLIGNPAGFTIGQFGKKDANVDNSKIVIFKSSTDIGLPKYSGFPKRYKETYFETKVVAGTETTIGYHLGCRVSMRFLPEVNEVYEFRVSFADRSGYCILYGTHMKYDEINDIYVEEPVQRINKK